MSCATRGNNRGLSEHFFNTKTVKWQRKHFRITLQGSLFLRICALFGSPCFLPQRGPVRHAWQALSWQGGHSRLLPLSVSVHFSTKWIVLWRRPCFWVVNTHSCQTVNDFVFVALNGDLSTKSYFRLWAQRSRTMCLMSEVNKQQISHLTKSAVDKIDTNHSCWFAFYYHNTSFQETYFATFFWLQKAFCFMHISNGKRE